MIHALMRMKDCGLVGSFEMNGQERAYVHLSSGESITVYMSKEYIIGISTIQEAMQGEPKPDYIIYNIWDRVTDSAAQEAKKLKVPLVGFGEFRRILEGLVGTTS